MAAEKKRGCGYRKIGGIYLCADGPGDPCDGLPIALDVCPTCHHGVKQTRGWTWVKPELLGAGCGKDKFGHCLLCPACTPSLLGEKAGLIWIGEKFYKTPAEFTREAIEQGVSRRVTAIPKGFKVGEHFILVAHPKAIAETSERKNELENSFGQGSFHDGQVRQQLEAFETKYTPGIFHIFRPSRIEKILGDDASPEDIKKWEDRGCKVVLLPANDKDHQGSVYDKDDEPEETTEANDGNSTN